MIPLLDVVGDIWSPDICNNQPVNNAKNLSLKGSCQTDDGKKLWYILPCWDILWVKSQVQEAQEVVPPGPPKVF
jgi:hypothetical protein